MSNFIPHGMGWIPDLPDPRDYTDRHEEVRPLLQQPESIDTARLPDKLDLRWGDEGEAFFTDVEDQGPLNSSTAFAVLSLIEYFERQKGRTFSGSRLFLYKVVRNLRGRKIDHCGDTGADFRTTFKALRQFGVPFEELWPYQPARVNEEPPAFVYQAANPVTDFHYFRLFGPETPSQRSRHEEKSTNVSTARWNSFRSVLAGGFPIAFGFCVPSSLSTDPNIPYRPKFDTYVGGMAVLAIGYDTHRYGRNRGAVLVRTSLGTEWGDNGNGWLPSAFVESSLATDFWTIATG